MNKNTIRTLSKFGIKLAREAFQLSREGNGPSNIAFMLDVRFNSANALIDAGRQVAHVESNYTRGY